MINPIVKTIELPDGRTITLETGKLAKQADGSVMLRMGNTMLLATVCAAKDAVPGTDFMPLQVEYKEKFSAFGRFPGGFTKREGRASDYEILTCRLVDRALRPLFPDGVPPGFIYLKNKRFLISFPVFLVFPASEAILCVTA